MVGEGDMVVWVLGYQDEKIKWGVGYFTPKSLMLSPCNHYHPPVKTTGEECEVSVVGEGIW